MLAEHLADHGRSRVVLVRAPIEHREAGSLFIELTEGYVTPVEARPVDAAHHNVAGRLLVR